MHLESYTTVFDVTTAGFKSWPFPASGLIFVVVGLALPPLIKLGVLSSGSPGRARWFPRLFLGLAVCWTTGVFATTLADYLRAVGTMRRHEAQVVEGPVEHFVPLPVTGHALESFSVQGVRFSYSDYLITAGFNRTASHGGPIREGERVRIWYLGGEILRLDVEPEPRPRADPGLSPARPGPP